ncbi:hypothetical protein ACHAPO_010239 [Fusarium lateritium]
MGCIVMAGMFDHAEDVERYLAYTSEQLRSDDVLDMFSNAVKIAIENMAHDDEVLTQWRKARVAVRKRADQIEGWENKGQNESEAESEDQQADEVGDQGNGKRRVSEDGRGEAKKQKTNAS